MQTQKYGMRTPTPFTPHEPSLLGGGGGLQLVEDESVVGKCCRVALLETGSQDPVATWVPT